MRLRRYTAVAVVIGLAVTSAPAVAQIERWDFPIREDFVANGNEPDGSTNSPATGYGHFAYDPATQTLHTTISWDGLEGDLTKLHVHGPALPGENQPNHLLEIFNTAGEVLSAGLDPRSDSFSSSFALNGTATLCSTVAGTPTQPASSTLPCLREGRVYVNVHTTVDPMGEIRGNAEPLDRLLAWDFPIDESQVKNGSESDGSTDSTATGEGTLLLDLASGLLDYRITWNGLEGDLTKLHLHGPSTSDQSQPNHLIEYFNTAGEVLNAGLDPRSDALEGSIALDLLATECSVTSVPNPSTASPAALPCFFEELAYVNVHTTVDPMGEIRGNLIFVPEPGARALQLTLLALLAAWRTRATASRTAAATVPLAADPGSGSRTTDTK